MLVRVALIGAALIVALLGGACATLASDKALIACQAADAITTIVALQKGAVEANPIMAAVIDKLGYAGLVLVKVGVVMFFMKYLKPEPEGAKPRPVETARAFVNVITCAVALNNVRVAGRL